MSKHCFDSKCLELAEYFYPHATREWLANLAQQFQDAAESAEDIDDNTLPIPDFLRNQDNLRAERAAQETPVEPCGERYAEGFQLVCRRAKGHRGAHAQNPKVIYGEEPI